MRSGSSAMLHKQKHEEGEWKDRWNDLQKQLLGNLAKLCHFSFWGCIHSASLPWDTGSQKAKCFDRSHYLSIGSPLPSQLRGQTCAMPWPVSESSSAAWCRHKYYCCGWEACSSGRETWIHRGSCSDPTSSMGTERSSHLPLSYSALCSWGEVRCSLNNRRFQHWLCHTSPVGLPWAVYLKCETCMGPDLLPFSLGRVLVRTWHRWTWFIPSNNPFWKRIWPVLWAQ